MSLSTFTPGIFSEVTVSTSAIKRVRTTAKCKNLIIFFNNAGIQKTSAMLRKLHWEFRWLHFLKLVQITNIHFVN